MSLATITSVYQSKAKSKAVGDKLKPVLENMASHTRDALRDVKAVKNAKDRYIPTGWEYFLNPLEYE